MADTIYRTTTKQDVIEKVGAYLLVVIEKYGDPEAVELAKRLATILYVEDDNEEREAKYCVCDKFAHKHFKGRCRVK